MRLLSICLLVACSGGGGGATLPPEPAPAPAPGPVAVAAPVSAAPTATAAVCQRALRCGVIGRSQLADCELGPGQSRMALVWGWPGWSRLRAAGPTVPADEVRCRQFLASAACDTPARDYPSGCSELGYLPAAPPSKQPGQACKSWDECIDGFCTAQTFCTGVCVARSPHGGACGDNQLCQEDEFCWKGTCHPRADVGAECRGHWQWCKDGLLCDGYQPEHEFEPGGLMPEVPGHCSAGKRLGEGCVPPQTSAGEVCSAPLYCDWGSPQPVCRDRLAAGAECHWIDACADGLVCAGIVLRGVHPTGKRYAVLRPGRCTLPADAGATCDPEAAASGCPASMTCDKLSHRCRSTGNVGDHCESSWVITPQPKDRPTEVEGCFSANYCDVKTRTCQQRLPEGARCTPQKFGAEDDPCMIGECNAKTHRCTPVCNRR